MSEYLQRRFASAVARSSWLWWTGLFLLLALGPTSALLSQEFPTPGPGPYFSEMGDKITDADEANFPQTIGDPAFGRSGQAFGALVRGGYVTGPRMGAEKGLAPLEIMPYTFYDTNLFFLDVRWFRGDLGHYGANLGGGYRKYIQSWDRIFGTNFFFDYDKTTGVQFQQWGFGIETYGELWDARANAYFPYGERAKFLGSSVNQGSERFAGHNLLYDITNKFATSLMGADAELGLPIPGGFGQRHDIRVYAGGYHYNSDATGTFAGWSGRLQGSPIPSLLLQLQVTNDHVFDTNVVFAAQFSFGGYRQPDGERPTQFSRMTTPVQRQYNVSVATTEVGVKGLVAINPVNNQPYFFNHVASYAPAGGDGTFENPFQTIGQTTPNNPGDIVFVHGDSVFNGSIAPNDNIVQLEAGQQNLPIRYLGDGQNIVHTVTIAGLGQVPLPSGTTGAVRPLFLNGIGDGVTLANYSEFSGFQVGDQNTPGSGPTGDGVFGGLVGGIPVHDVVLAQDIFAYAGGNGLHFNNVGSNIVITDTIVTNPTGVGMLVENGTPGITFGHGASTILSGSSIVNDGNIALVVRNTLAGSSVDMTNSSITNTNSSAEGILIESVAGNVLVDRASITAPTTFGIEIFNLSGTFTGRGTFLIGNPGDDGIDIRNLQSTGSVQFSPVNSGGSVTISGRNQTGINIFNDAGQIAFRGPVTISGVNSGTAPAIDWQNNIGSTLFAGGITITDSGGDGIDLGNAVTVNTGSFTTRGTVAVAGNIAGQGIQITNNTGTIAFQNDVIIGGRTLQGINIHDNNGPVSFNGITGVQNGTPVLSASPAIDIQRNTFGITFNTINITDAFGNETPAPYGAGLNILNNPSSVTISNALIDTTINGGIALFASNAGVIAVDNVNNLNLSTGGLFIADGRIAATAFNAVDIANSVININLTSVDSDGSARQGIRLENNIGTTGSLTDTSSFAFAVTGDASNTPGSGGTITASNFAGIRVANTLVAANGTTLVLPGLNVSFSNMVLDANGLYGVHSISNTRLDLFNDQITNNGADGVFATDTQIVNITGTGQQGILNFDSNGSVDDTVVGRQDHEIHLQAVNGQKDNFQWTLTNNQIVHALGNAAVLVDNAGSPAAAGSTVTFLEQRDVTTLLAATPLTIPVRSNAQSASGTTVNWNGDVNATYLLNQYTMTAGTANGLVFNAFSNNANDLAVANILSNRIVGLIGSNVGIDVASRGQAFITIDRASGVGFGNIITLDDGTSALGRDIGIFVQALGANSTITINNTNLGANPNTEGFIHSDQSTAIAFQTTTAPATININNNTFNMENVNFAQSLVGINLGTIIGGQADISGVNNVINTSTPFFLTPFIPATNQGTTNGTIEVNGVQYPQ